MNEDFILPEPLRKLLSEQTIQNYTLPPHYYLQEIGIDFEVDSQLKAIHALIVRNKAAETELLNQIRATESKALKATGEANENLVGLLDSLVQDSVFLDAAHSMSAVGMLAPFVETIFTECFRGIGKKCLVTSPIAQNHERWIAAQSIHWDCHYFIEKGQARKDLVKGILQLSNAISLLPRLPSDIEMTLSALFAYRNKMFHCGFEWPVEERQAFKKRIDDGHWPEKWFLFSSTNGVPWIYYMSDEFVDHCLKTTDEVIRAFSELIRDVPMLRS